MTDNDQQLKDRALSYLTQDELYSIEKILGREPNPFELNMFAAMWSEHISYKSSIKWIEEMPEDPHAIWSEIAARAREGLPLRCDDDDENS